METRSRSLFAMFTAIVCWIALLLQLRLSIGMSLANGSDIVHGLSRYFVYFTILTNWIVAFVLTVALIAPTSRVGRFAASARTIAGVAVNIALVGIIYNVLLRHTWNPQGLRMLADILLHDAVPVLFLIHAWLSARTATLADRLCWALWPVAYFFYAMLRGAASGFYPYPFINVGDLGYMRVLVNSIGMLAGYFAVAAILFAIDRKTLAATFPENARR